MEKGEEKERKEEPWKGGEEKIRRENKKENMKTEEMRKRMRW